MNPWIFIGLVGATIVFFLDYLVRRKKWKENTKAEKISLLVHMFSVGIYAFTSILGMFWGITECTANTVLGEKIYDVTLAMAWYIWVVALAATIGAFILRKKQKTKASTLINVITVCYIVLVFVINGLTGLI